jgi:phosphatidylglycerol:prolipoprotein diacylglycerol transferase
MYPTLYHAVHALLGLDLQLLKLVNTFGFLVALAFLAAARCLGSELQRKYAAGQLVATIRPAPPLRPPTVLDAVLSSAMVFVVAFKLFGIVLGEHVLQGGTDVQRYLLSTQGHLWAGLICAGGWMALELRKWRNAAPLLPTPSEPELIEVAPRDHTLGITGAAALGGLIGAKVFAWLERPESIVELFEHPSMEAIFSGLAIYGGLIVGACFVYVYCRRAKLPFSHVCDANAPGLMLAYGIGRLGCQLAGDGDWGIPSKGAPSGFGWLPSWFWSFDYPNNVLGHGVPMASGGYAGFGTHLVPPVYPTPLYEALAAFSFFALLWYLRQRIARPLVLFSIYLMLNGFERFWIEKIRVNATYDLFGKAVTQAELISVLMFLGGAALLFWQLRKGDQAAPPSAAPAAAK